MIYAIIFSLIVICQVVFMFWKKKSPTCADLPISSESLEDSPDSAMQSLQPKPSKRTVLLNKIKPLLLYNPKDRKIENFCFIAFGIILLYMSSLRDGIGYDWDNYLNIFNAYRMWEMSLLEGFRLLNIEPGFAFLNMIIPNFHLLIFVIAIFSVSTKLWAISKYSEAKYISLLMYFAGIFIAYDMGIIRQAISISMLLIGLGYIRDRKLIKFLLVIIAGSLFHISTLIFIPLYFINYRRFSRITIYIVTAVALVLYFVDITQILVFVLNLFPIDFITQRLENYLDYETPLILSLAKRIVVLVVFVEFYERFKINDKMSRIFLNSYILSVVLMAVFSSIPHLGARGVMGLYFLQIFIFAKIFAVSDKRLIKLGLLAVIVALSIDTMSSIIIEGNATNQPYTPFRSYIGTLFGW